MGVPVSSSARPRQRWCWSCEGRRGTGGGLGGLQGDVPASGRGTWRQGRFSSLSGNAGSGREARSGSGSLCWEPAALGFIVGLPALLETEGREAALVHRRSRGSETSSSREALGRSTARRLQAKRCSNPGQVGVKSPLRASRGSFPCVPWPFLHLLSVPARQ